MESLNEMEAPDKAKPVKNLDRITLGAIEIGKVDQWIKQVQETSKGFLTLSRSDLVAFILREHREELVPTELKRIRSDHYDPIKHMQWIMPQIKGAWSRSDLARVAELQEELRGVEISRPRGVTAGASEIASTALSGTRKKGRKQKGLPDLTQASELSENATGIDESADLLK